RQEKKAPDCRAATISIAPQRQSKSGDNKNPCEAQSCTRSSLRYRPPLHTPTAATVLIQIVAQQHREVVPVGVHVDFGVVAAVPAGDIEPAHAVLAHVAEGHRSDRFVGPAHRRGSAISFAGSSLNSLAAFSMASRLSAA